jgi:rod shape-determining protein MreC
MHWIVEFIIRYRNFCSLVFTVVLSLLMISSPENRQLATARFLTTSIFYPLQFVIDKVTNISNIYEENHRLRQEVVILSTKVAALQEQAAENDRLRGMLNFAQNFTYNFIPVRVVAHDPSEFNRSIVINAGKNQGVLQWMPVVGEKGVVGKVVQVMGGLSLVQLLKDPANRISVIIKQPRAIGVLESNDGNDFYLRCRSHENVVIGDTVITSGLGGIYPPGLQVGMVTKISDSGDPLFKKAWIKLSVDFDHIEELFVMQLSPQWSAFVNEFDSLGFTQ